jgi:hypothetical protein
MLMITWLQVTAWNVDLDSTELACRRGRWTVRALAFEREGFFWRLSIVCALYPVHSRPTGQVGQRVAISFQLNNTASSVRHDT